MSLCGLRKPPPLRRRPKPVRQDKGKSVLRPDDSYPSSTSRGEEKGVFEGELSEKDRLVETESSGGGVIHRRSANFDWAREDQLSTIDEESRKNTPNWQTKPAVPPRPRRPYSHVKRARFVPVQPRAIENWYAASLAEKMSYSSLSKTIETIRPIAPPPRDLESIARIDSSLIFEHFTTDDAWELGSALRNRLLAISTPVVINIALANQNQTLFHTCTHPGAMPDNDTWVARKRKTVLRWGCSTWYMHCKFAGDQVAFKEKYGLGNSAGEYAIHGGGVPIRVTGVEGVVAVVVVSGLKQDEDHGVIVEVIRELYY